MLFVHARTNLVVVRLHAIFLALMIAAGLAFVTTNPGRGEESPAYAIEVSDVTAKVGERAVMQAKLRIRDGYRILQSYNNRVIKLSAEDDGVAFEQEMVRASIEEGVLVFAVPLRATKPADIRSTEFSASATSMTATRWRWCRFASLPASPERNSRDGIGTDAKLKISPKQKPRKEGDATCKRATIGVLPATDVVRFLDRFLGWRWHPCWSA